MPVKPHTLHLIGFIAGFAMPAVAQEMPRLPVQDARSLMVEALSAPSGQAHGILVGAVADAISKTFSTPAPILVDVRTERRLGQTGCARLLVRFSQGQLLFTGAGARVDRSVELGINYCADGMPPVHAP